MSHCNPRLGVFNLYLSMTLGAAALGAQGSPCSEVEAAEEEHVMTQAS